MANRLIHEKSPYLLQHANNPVDWYPWGEEAFKSAKEQDKPIFLSIGYATCHWCHVMEHESFENEAIAKLMNDSFINVKVDREELPEVDALYMEFAQAIMPGGGGWPLNVLLTPTLEPFFATTYIPPDSGKGFIGFQELMTRLQELWKDPDEREKLIEQANQIVAVFTKEVHIAGSDLPDKEMINNSAEVLFHMADPVYGGIKGEPKFPMGYHSCFLLYLAKQSGDSRAMFCVEMTLDMMHRGGIYDHLGGGFSRYTIDGKWQIPHFEKMLYDNAILLRAYVEAFLFTRKPFYKEVGIDILRYLFDEMRAKEGAFYSAEDADSAGREGLYYTWTQEEIKDAIGSDAQLIFDYFAVSKQGNFEGRNVLHIRQNLEEFAKRRNIDVATFKQILERAKGKLKEERDLREKPFKDDKILSSWNGLIIHALALAGRAFGDPSYIESAKEVAEFIYKNLWKDGHLLRRFRDGEARYHGGLDEYAFVIHGVLTLFETTSDSKWLKWAMELADVLEFEFKAERGAFYLSDGKDPGILLRRAEFYDGAEPSGNGMHCENLLRLYQITFDESYLKQAEDILMGAKKYMDHHPAGCCYSLIALQRYYDRHAATLVVALNSMCDHEKDIKNILNERFLPHLMVIWKKDASLDLFAEHMKDLIALDDQTTIYVCRRGQCQKPVSDFDEIKKQLLAL